MDRQKQQCRAHKKNLINAGAEFFALGAKSSKDEKKLPTKCNTSASADRKREASSHASTHKKIKLTSFEFDSIGTWNESRDLSSTNYDYLGNLEKLLSLFNDEDDERTFSLLNIITKTLTYPNSRSKLDLMQCFILLYIAKIRPMAFDTETIIANIVSFFRLDSNIKARYNQLLHIVFTNILTLVCCEREIWPDIFLRLYVEDAVNDRIWCDLNLCAPFTENICSAFMTKAPKNVPNSDGIPTVSAPQYSNEDIGDPQNVVSCFTKSINIYDLESVYVVRNRYQRNGDSIENHVIHVIKEQFQKRQQQECFTRNFLKFLCTTSGLVVVRQLCAPKLEIWLHNGKLVKSAQQLLAFISLNVDAENANDQEALAIIAKMRLKTKPLLNFHINCVKEMLVMQPKVLSVFLKVVVQNELSNARNPNNMGILVTMFQTFPQEAAEYLAEIYKEFLLQREDCLRTLRVFLRELVRMLRYDFNIQLFCKSFLNDKSDLKNVLQQLDFKDRIFQSMVDITCLCMLLTVSPQIREAYVSVRSIRENQSNSLLLQFYNDMSSIQLKAISWMYETVPDHFRIQGVDYGQALQKLLLLENPEYYSRSDQWPSEPERSTLLRMASETPIQEEALLRIILIGITKEIPFTIPDTIEIIILVIKRAAGMRLLNCPAIRADKLEIIDFLFSMVEYHYPENIQLPENYEPPKLAITILYWKVWMIILLISAHNPLVFGAFCWNNYPTMKILIEMCITNQMTNVNNQINEQQILTIEKRQVLEFEAYLAAKTSQTVITADTAILTSQLTLLDPMGPPRRVPTVFIEQIKVLSKTLRLGNLLCRSRKPDFLLDIIQRRGTSECMPWLSDLVQSSEGDFSHLPVQCLCEFLLFSENLASDDDYRDDKLIDYLRNLIFSVESKSETVCEVFDYIFRRMASTNKKWRTASQIGSNTIFNISDKKNTSWLLHSIPQNPHFNCIVPIVIPHLRAACQVETSPKNVMTYIQFIVAHALDDSASDMLHHVIDMAQLIVERNTLFHNIVPIFIKPDSLSQKEQKKTGRQLQTLKCLYVMFNNYIIKLREQYDAYEWSEYPDLILVQFEDGIQLPLHLNVIHAFIILLSYLNHNLNESFSALDYWFPSSCFSTLAFVPNLPNEPIQLFPDWLKLKMIRSPVEKLVNAALNELTPDQIVLFVQNFGTPVHAMSKLLALLDRAVINQRDAVQCTILNKSYLAELIEIQHARGAKNGHLTIQTLDLVSNVGNISKVSKIYHKLKLVLFLKNILIQTVDIIDKSKFNLEKILHLIFDSSNLSKVERNGFRKVIFELLIASQFVRGVLKSSVFNSCDPFCNILEDFEKKIFSDNNFLNPNLHVCTVLRVFSRCLRHSKIHFDLMLHKKATNNFLLNFDNYEKYSKNQCFQSSLLLIHLGQQNSINTSVPKFPLKGNCSYKMYHDLPLLSISSPVKMVSMDAFLSKSQFIRTGSIISDDGILVDWISEVDPELTVLYKEKQINSIFAKISNGFWFYLLALVCHQTNWDTVISFLNELIDELSSEIDGLILLSFIEALVNNPKLWQGHDKFSSRVILLENDFLPSESEVNVMWQHFLIDRKPFLNWNSNFPSNIINSHIPRLAMLAHKRYGNFDLTKIFEVFMSSTCAKSSVDLLYAIYLMGPAINFMKCIQTDEENQRRQSSKNCHADRTTNYLITCLGSLISKRDFEMFTNDTDILVRKMASSHPKIFLRQLGVLMSLIHGKSDINVRVLRDEHHSYRLIQILRILELLQPILYDDFYQSELQISLEVYFTFLKCNSYVKETYHILGRFIDILQTYVIFNPRSAGIFLQKYVDVLMHLSLQYNSFSSLHHLLQTIALIAHHDTITNTNNRIEVNNIGDDVNLKPECISNLTYSLRQIAVKKVGGKCRWRITTSGYSKKIINFSVHINGLVNTLKNSNTEEMILNSMQEIENLTSKRFSFLTELFDRLLELIFSPCAQIRSSAYVLLIRHLKNNAGCAETNRFTLNSYIQCLSSKNLSIATTAVDNLKEITLLLQENSVEILTVAFGVGMKSGLNTGYPIKRVIQSLMLQRGF